MRKTMSFATVIAGLTAALLVSASAVADFPKRIDVPAGDLATALAELAKQSGVELMYSSVQLKGLHTDGVRGEYTTEGAAIKLIEGTNLTLKVHESGGLLISDTAEPEIGSSPTYVSQTMDTHTSQVKSSALAQSNVRSDQSADEARAGGRDGSKSTISEIIVTAQKREERVLDVPISITAIPGNELAKAGITNALDLSFAVPSMAVMEQRPGRQQIVIRGIGGERGTSALTGLYLDEIPLTGSTTGNEANIDLRTGDLQRVEVLKGPQGTLFGEGSVGGTVRFITNDPVLDRVEGSAEGTYFATDEGDPSTEFKGVLNLPVAQDVFAIRIATTYENRGGWIDKVPAQGAPVAEANFNDSETREIRIKALWKPSDALTLRGMVVAHRTEGEGSNIVNVDPDSASEYQPAFDISRPQDFKSNYEIYNLKASYDLGFAELLSSTSHVDIATAGTTSQVFPGILGPFMGIFELESGNSNDTSVFSQELRLTSSGTGPFKWTIGGFYKDSETLNTAFGSSILLDGTPLGPEFNGKGNQDVLKSEARAAFADASYDLTDRLEAGGGLRYFEDKRAVFNPVNVAPTRVAGTFHKLTYRAFVSYRVADDLRIYANTSTGFRSGGFNLPSNIAQGAPPSYGPESVRAYEIGAKGSFFGDRLRADVALFTSDYVDIQADVTVPASNNIGLIGFTANPGEGRIEGIEGSLNWRVTDNWLLSFNGDITDVKVTEVSNVPSRPIDVGDNLDFVPEYSFSVSSDYTFALSDEVAGGFRIDCNEQGRSTYTFRRSLTVETVATAPVVRFLNASLRMEWNDWTTTLFGRNLLNEEKSIRPGPTGINTQARPRSVGVTVSKEF